jgi:hypothetical protein
MADDVGAVHSALLESLPDVDDAFLQTHREVLLAAVGEVPGVDSVRAAVVRLLPRLVTEPLALEGHLQAAARALRAYPDAVTAGDPLALMARHPAWVGLAHLEVAEALGGDPSDAFAVAVEHARLGFSAAAGGAVQDGEVLWAMAETAEEAGWRDRAEQLLSRAVDAPFADPVSRCQVLLLAGQSVASSDPERASGYLTTVLDADVPHPLQVQAAFVLAHIAESDGDFSASVHWLQDALGRVDPEDDPRVAATLRERIAVLTGDAG